MKFALIIVVVLIVLVGAIVAIGSRLPRNHVASRSLVVRGAPADVYAIVRDVENAPSWRGGVKRVELLSPTRFREHGKNGVVTYEIVEDAPPRRMATRIVDQDLGYSGSWTYELAPDAGGTRVTITEYGEVSNPLFRFLSRYVFGHTATMDAYLASLSKRLR